MPKRQEKLDELGPEVGRQAIAAMREAAEVQAMEAGQVTAGSMAGILDAWLARNEHLLSCRGDSNGDSGEGKGEPELEPQPYFTWGDSRISPLPEDWELPTGVSLEPSSPA